MAKVKRTKKTARGPRAAGSKGTAPRRKAKPRPSPERARKPPSAEEAAAETGVFGVDVEPGSVETTLEKVREELAHWVKKGRYTKVRLKLRGQPILPDIPVAAFLAAEAVTFWWAGLLRVLLVHVGAKAVLDVELVSDADLEVSRGKAALLAGDLDLAMVSFEKALTMDRDCASAHLNLGIAFKLKGDLEKASELLRRTEQLDAQGPCGDEARRLLDQLAERGRGKPPG
jgi:tetratricopeptide (TPR) repeat protein